MKVKPTQDTRSKFEYFRDSFLGNRIDHPRQGDEVNQDLRAAAIAGFEAGWEAAGGEWHKSRDDCKHSNVRGIAVVARPCPSCGKPVF